jgi:hypothetical protein
MEAPWHPRSFHASAWRYKSRYKLSATQSKRARRNP